MSKINWNEENTQRLESAVAGMSVVSQDTVSQLAEDMDTTPRSIGAKLRRLGYEVEKASAKSSAWTEEQEAALRALVESNANQMTYSELAAVFENGAFTSKQIQGKLLNMELYHLVRKAEKKTAPRTYTPEEETRFVAMAKDGASIEDLAEAFGKTIASIRGKALSLTRSGDLDEMPKQVTSTAKDTADPISELNNIGEMTVAEIAEATGKTERGIKSALSRRGVSCADYDGAARRAKLDAKSAE
jgi:transposase-like protein